MQDKRMFYFTGEVQDAFGITRQALYRAIENGEVPAQRIGHRYFIPRSFVDRWLPGGKASASPVEATAG